MEYDQRVLLDGGAVNISRFEWRVIQKLRVAQFQGFGEVHVVFKRGICAELKGVDSVDPKILEEEMK